MRHTLSMVIVLLVCEPPLLTHAFEISKASPYGAADRLGAINYLSTEKVRQAKLLIKTGKVYSLALESSQGTPAFGNRSYQLFVEKISGTPLGKNRLTGFDDRLSSHLGIGTQIDGLGHVGINHIYYSGVHEDELFHEQGLKLFGIHTLPPIVTRGILLDMAAYFGVDMVHEGPVYNTPEIKGALKRQRIEIEKGDVILFHSGWLQLYGHDNKRWLSAHPGLGKSGAEFLANQGVVAVGADTAALEVIPFEDPGAALCRTPNTSS